MSRAEGPFRLAFYGLFGVGNIGNEGTLSAIIGEVHHIRPGIRMSILGWDPARTQRQHGLPGTRFTLLPLVRIGGPAATIAKVGVRLADVARTLHLVGTVDAVVVPGTGALEEQIGTRPWGIPYWLAVAGLGCRLRGRPFALVSVGADDVSNPIMRWLFRLIVSSSTYHSFRDEYSRACARRFGVRAKLGPVLPDLAFALAVEPHAARASGNVAVGVMTYYGPRDDATRGRHVHERYVEEMSHVIEDVLVQGRDVTLIIGDRVDLMTADALVRAVGRRDPGLAERIAIADVDDLSAVVRQMAACDAVVATRYHNVIGGILAGRPTVSLGYAEKNAEVMRSVGLGEYCQDLVSFDRQLLLAQLREVEQRWPELEPGVTAVVADLRRAVREQVASVLNLLGASASDRSQTAGLPGQA